jgi:AcrR family transcriptional regulator
MSSAPKAVRAEKITPRWPVRADSRLRFDTLMAAVGRLLKKHNPSAITIQLIADAAKMPAATVYHFFPSVEAALLAQARVFVDAFETEMEKPTPVPERTTWQHAWHCAAQRGRETYRQDVARMRLLLGADVPQDVQIYDANANVRMGRIIAAKLERETHLPAIPHFAQACANAIEINDTFWRMSYRRTGTITDAFFDESQRAVIAYLSLYLPEHLEFRPA